MAVKKRTLLSRMVLRSLWNNRRISVWTLSTLALCAALITLFGTISLEVGAKMRQTLSRLGANAVAYPAVRGTADWNGFARVTKAQGVPFVLLALRVGLIDGRPIAIVAGKETALAEMTPYWAVTGRRPAAPGECLVGRHAAKVLGIKLGQAIKVQWPDRGRSSSLVVAGILESGDEDDNRVFTTRLPGRSDFSYALLSVPSGNDGLAKFRKALAASPLRIDFKPLRQIVRGQQTVLDKIRILCLTTLGVVLALAALGVSASLLARVVERGKEFALLQALGAHRRGVVTFLLAESATLGTIAAAVGFALGTGLAAIVMWQIFQVTIVPEALAFVGALGVTLTVALLAGAIACRRILGLQPAAVLKGE